MVLREFLGLVDLTKAQTFYIHELMEVIIISKDKNFIFTIFQIVTLSLKNFNNSQEFLIVSLVSSLNGNYLLMEKSY